MLRSLLILCLVFASPGLAQQYQWKELANATHDFSGHLTVATALAVSSPAGREFFR
jgi:Tfp pilus assembly protein FimT